MINKKPTELNAKDIKSTIPEKDLAPQVIRPLQKVVKNYDFKFKLGFSFGFFSFLISPIILFQSVLLFLFLLTANPGTPDSPLGLVDGSFLMLTVRMLFYSILLFIVVNLFTSLMGILFDKRRLFAVIALVITTVSLVFVFLGPKLSQFSMGVFGDATLDTSYFDNFILILEPL